MKKTIILILISLFLVPVFLAFNPLDYVPADVDAAVEISVPEELISAFGVDLNSLGSMDIVSEWLNPDVELRDMKAVVFGKFGLNTLLMESLDIDYLYDLEDIFDEEIILALANMPLGIITNAINTDIIFSLLEGDFMQEAIQAGVDFQILTETISDQSVKHYRIRYYDDYQPVFFDLYFAELEENYTLATTQLDLIELAIQAKTDETIRLSHYNVAMADNYFVKFQNNGLNISSLLLRMLNIYSGKPQSEFIGIGATEDNITLDFLIDMAYINEKLEKNSEAFKTDMEFFSAMPSFKDRYDVTTFISIPKTNIPLELLGEMLYEIPMLDTYLDDMENYFELLPLMGPELERVNLCFGDEAYSPYMLAKCSDAEMVFKNFVEMYELETATVGYIEYSYADEVYIGYDSRYDYIEIYDFGIASFGLRQGKLLFTKKLLEESDFAEYIPELPKTLWGVFNFDDYISMTVDFDETANFKAHMSFNLVEIMKMFQLSQQRTALYDISDGYYQIMTFINDMHYYYPDKELTISQISEEVESSYGSYNSTISDFKISQGLSDDKKVYNVYYNGIIPAGLTPQDLKDSVESNIYESNVEVLLKGDIVLMRIFEE